VRTPAVETLERRGTFSRKVVATTIEALDASRAISDHVFTFALKAYNLFKANFRCSLWCVLPAVVSRNSVTTTSSANPTGATAVEAIPYPCARAFLIA